MTWDLVFVVTSVSFIANVMTHRACDKHFDSAYRMALNHVLHDLQYRKADPEVRPGLALAIGRVKALRDEVAEGR